MLNGIKRGLKMHLALSMAWNGDEMYYYLKSKDNLDTKNVVSNKPINLLEKAENELISLIAKDISKEIKKERKKHKHLKPIQKIGTTFET